MNFNYIKRIILWGAIGSLGLSSCQIVNKYKTPEVDTSDLFRDQSETDTTTIASIPWREYFSDPLLITLIEEGLNQNYDLRIAYERITEAELTLGIAKAAYFPEVALVGQAADYRTSKGPDGKEKFLRYNSQDYSLGISVTWEADFWGKLNRQSRAKYADLLNSHAYRNLVQTSLISNIATSYYSLMALDEQLKITKETVGLLRENVETMDALMQAGMQNGAAVEQSKSLLYSTEATIPDLESQINQVENSLSNLLGRKPGPVVRSSINNQEVPKEIKIGIPVQMLANRPDVQQAELSFRSAFELKNAAQASFYPSITLSSGSMIGFGTQNTLSQFFKAENIFANIVGGLTQPIFARKQLMNNYKIAKSQQKQTLLAFESAVLTAGQEVSDILFSFESSLRKNDTRASQVESSQKAVEYTQELLLAGEANYTEVLDAEQNLLSSLLTQVNDKLEQLQYSVTLYRALGGGVQ